MKFKMKIRSGSRERRATNESLRSASSLAGVPGASQSGRRSVSPNNISHQSIGDSAMNVSEDNILLHSSSVGACHKNNSINRNRNNANAVSSRADNEAKRRSCGLLSSLKLSIEQTRAFSVTDDDDGIAQTQLPKHYQQQQMQNHQQQQHQMYNGTQESAANDSQSSASLHPNNSRRESSLSQRQVSPTATDRSRNDSNASRSLNSRPSSRQERRRQFQKGANLDSVHVVVGNEACDLDSAVSCLLMFHILNKTANDCAAYDMKLNGHPRKLYISLLNIERSQLETKTEVLWYLKKTLNIDKSHLTCKDDIDWAEIKKMGVEVLVTLVDHNHNEEFSKIGRIVEIVDHHQIQNREELLANHPNIRLTLDPTVGSCTTLLAERLFYTYAEHHVADEILMLIYGTVLLDTICLSERARRYTHRDVYLLNKIDSLLGPLKRPSRQDLYKSLVEVKNCTAKEMNFESLLTRDLKVFQETDNSDPSISASLDDRFRVAIASLFGVAAQEALGLAANVDLDAFFDLHKCQAFIIMGLITDLANPDSISRDLVVITRHRRLFEVLTSALESTENKLDLSIIKTNPEDHPDHKHFSITFDDDADDSADESHSLGGYDMRARSPSARSVVRESRFWARLYNQRNVSASRKVVAPIVVTILRDGHYRHEQSTPSSNIDTTSETARDSEPDNRNDLHVITSDINI